MMKPTISVAVLNCNNKAFLDGCLSSLYNLNYPREALEFIVIDNGSRDGSQEFIQRNFPDVKLMNNSENLGFSKANNIAAALCRGEYIAFLNSDTRVHKDWLLELIQPIDENDKLVCAASKILNWDGKKIDFAGAGINFYGFGFQRGIGESADRYKDNVYILAACGAAMLIKKKVFLEIGGFDDNYFIYFEDLDLGWRLWVLGYKVIYVPRSIVYHKGHGTTSNWREGRKRFLVQRNALFTIMKNYEEENLYKILPAALLLGVGYAQSFSGSVKRSSILAFLRNAGFWEILIRAARRIKTGDFLRNPDQVSYDYCRVLAALTQDLPAINKKRGWIQANRKRADKEIFTLFRDTFKSVSQNPGFVQAQDILTKEFGIAGIFSDE